MKNSVKKALAFALAATLITGATLALESPEEKSIYEVTAQMDPRFTHISRISSGLSISTAGKASCTGSYTIYKTYDYDSRMTITLQRDDNGWKDVQTWSEDYTGSGFKILDKSYYVERGYRYRLITEMQILDDSGKVLESATCDSPIKEY